MYGLGIESLNTKRFDTEVPMLYLKAIRDISSERPNWREYYKKPEVFDNIRKLYEGVLSEVTEDNMSASVAEGNVISTPSDLALWVRSLIRGEAGVNKEYIDMMKCQPEEGTSSCYGMGILCIKGLGYGHNGGTEGYISLMLYDPNVDVALVVFFGVSNGDHVIEQFHFINEVGSEARKVLGYKSIDSN